MVTIKEFPFCKCNIEALLNPHALWEERKLKITQDNNKMYTCIIPRLVKGEEIE